MATKCLSAYCRMFDLFSNLWTHMLQTSFYFVWDMTYTIYIDVNIYIYNIQNIYNIFKISNMQIQGPFNKIVVFNKNVLGLTPGFKKIQNLFFFKFSELVLSKVRKRRRRLEVSKCFSGLVERFVTKYPIQKITSKRISLCQSTYYTRWMQKTKSNFFYF